MVTLNNDKTQLQEHIDQLNESCETYGMKISTSKTEVMTVSKRPDKMDININGTQLKQPMNLNTWAACSPKMKN